MPPLITALTPMTELEAVNKMLSGIGESPLDPGTDLSTATQSDVAMALEILRNTTIDLQTLPWKFNTEFGLEIAPAATFSWPDTGGVTASLNIFKPPAGMASFEVTATRDQLDLDVSVSPSRVYQETSQPVLVFYDRGRARDGFEASRYPYLYINPVWMHPFEMLPQTARAYIVAKAGREFVESSLGSDTLSKFTVRNESLALRALKRDQGAEDDYLFLSTDDRNSSRGGRIPYFTGFTDTRMNRDHT